MTSATQPSHSMNVRLGIGKCIYCDHVPTSMLELTEEHVIPQGLGGIHSIEKASCYDCNKITNRFETHCLNSFLFPARLSFSQIKRKRRGKGKRRSYFPLVVEHWDGSCSSVSSFLGDTPVLTTLPVYLPPIFWLGTSPNLLSPQNRVGTYAATIKDHIKLALPDFNVKSYGLPFVENAFCRMLAKIAHCTLVWQLGGQFTPILAKYIRGSETFGDNYFVGCINGNTYSTDKSHRLLHTTNIGRTNKGYLIVKIHLFAGKGTPSYDVVAGYLNYDQLAAFPL